VALDDITINGNKVSTDKDADDRHYQFFKLAFGEEDAFVIVADDSGTRLPVKVGEMPAITGAVSVTALPGGLSGVDLGATFAAQKAVPIAVVRQDTAAALQDNGELTTLTVDELNRLRVATLASLRSTDSVSAALAVDRLMSHKTELTPKFAFLNAAAATANQQIVAPVTGKRIRVVSLRLMGVGTAGSATFRSGTGTSISETFNFDVRSGPMLGFSPVGHFETAVGEALGVSTVGASATCSVGVVYVEL
jgi:hypothetical protein